MHPVTGFPAHPFSNACRCQECVAEILLRVAGKSMQIPEQAQALNRAKQDAADQAHRKGNPIPAPNWNGKVDLRKVRKAARGKVWFRWSPEWGCWDLVVGKYNTTGKTLEEALAKALLALHAAASADGFCA